MQTKSTRSKKPAAHSLHRLVEMFDSPAQRLKCHAAAYVETSAKYFAADDWNALAAEWIVRSSPQMLGLFTRNKTRSDSTEKNTAVAGWWYSPCVEQDKKTRAFHCFQVGSTLNRHRLQPLDFNWRLRPPDVGSLEGNSCRLLLANRRLNLVLS